MPLVLKDDQPEQRLVYGEVAEGYWVRSDGSVWSTRPLNGRGPLLPWESRRPLKATRQGNGYMTVVINRQTRAVHALVLNAFVGPSNGKQCRHLDGDPTNNRLENLCWGTATEQAQDRELHGTKLRGSAIGNARLTEAQVLEARQLNATQSYTALAKKYGVSKSCISFAITGRNWSHL